MTYSDSHKSFKRLTALVSRLTAVIILTISTGILAGCGSTSPSDMITEARQMADNGDYKDALEMCRDIVDHYPDLSASEYAQLSLIVVQISEADDFSDPTELLAIAISYYDKALQLNSDSAISVMTSLSNADDLHRAGLLRLLTESPREISTEDTDSTGIDSLISHCDSIVEF